MDAKSVELPLQTSFRNGVWSIVLRGLLSTGRPRRQDGFVECRVAFDEDRRPNVMKHGHQRGVGLADPQGAAVAIEPEVMSQ
jgi:hypothetical protein